ncbi:MAG: glycosyltransferase [Thermaerobacter sp.]|nr:glycosyltransferase [Thermaerobacter sp.]
MRLAVVTRRLSGRGGMETAIRTLVREAARQGVSVEVWMMGRPRQADWLHGLTARIWAIDQGTGRRLQLKSKLPLYAWALWRGLRRYPVDAVLATDPVFVAASLYARRFASHPPAVLSWLHFSLAALANTPYLRLADGHLAISQGIAGEIAALDPKAAPEIVYNPLPDQPYPLLPASPTTQFLYIGRLANRQKRVDLLLASLSRLAPAWHLTVVGEGPDRAMLQHVAQTLGIAERVTWTGWQTNPWALTASLSALVLTSDYEGFPMVLLEALARGVPVVATDCATGPRDIVRPGENGWLVPPGHAEPLTAALQLAASGRTTWDRTKIQEDACCRFGARPVVTRILQTVAASLAPLSPANAQAEANQRPDGGR